ncbi:MAG: hypothetical protein ACE5KM_21040 [Planctomycetaceae bacterium]
MAMRFYGKAENAANAILEAFQNPNELPAALAPVFIRKNDDSVPCHKWSWSNQLITALRGHSDARGFRQWQQVGRHVKRGETSFQILVPITRKGERETDNGTETFRYVCGFKSAAVFGLSQTDGKPLEDPNPELTRWIDSLPLIEVARDWGIDVGTYNGENASAYGKYSAIGAIALGVRNVSTWAHEMVHAADDRKTGGLKGGQHVDQEIVAEFGSAILLRVLGQEQDADLGGAWEYIQAYAKAAKIEPVAACLRFLNRTCDAVGLILDTASELAAAAA